MAETPLRKNQAVNFHLPGESRLLHFLSEWFESELRNSFRIVVITAAANQPKVVQLIPRGETAGEDSKYLKSLDESLQSGHMRDWKQYSEVLPRLETGLGIPLAEPV